MTQAWAVGVDWKCARDFAPISMPSVVDLPDQCDRIWHGIRGKERKLVLEADDSPWLFFDLAQDPHETVNLALASERRSEIEQLITRI